MIFGAVVLLAVGATCLFFGILIGKFRYTGLIHDYHRDKLKKENEAAYCRLFGAGIALLGIGNILGGILFIFTESALAFIATGAGFAVGLPLMIAATAKYNK